MRINNEIISVKTLRIDVPFVISNFTSFTTTFREFLEDMKNNPASKRSKLEILTRVSAGRLVKECPEEGDTLISTPGVSS